MDLKRKGISDMKKRPLVIVLILAGFLYTSACNQHKSPPADTVLIHARIYTVNAKKPWAQAIAIRAGKIIAVGSDKEIAAYQRPFHKSDRCERAHGASRVDGRSCPHDGRRCST